MVSRRSTRARGEGEPRRHQATEPTSCPSPHMAQCISTGGHESDQAKREVDPLSTTGPSVCSRGARPSHASGTTGTRTRFSQQRARHIHSPPSASSWTWIGDTPPRPNTLLSIPSKLKLQWHPNCWQPLPFAGARGLPSPFRETARRPVTASWQSGRSVVRVTTAPHLLASCVRTRSLPPHARPVLASHRQG